MRYSIAIALGAAILVHPGIAAAETFRSFVCDNGSQFVAAFYPSDPKRAHLQIDGRAVALRKRLALSGARYTGGGITLSISKAGSTSIKHDKRAVTACSKL